MLHEITYISIGLEDIHPPAFFELLGEIRQQYCAKLSNGEVAAETDDYGCQNIVVTKDGQLKTVEDAAGDVISPDVQLGVLNEEGQCGARKGGRRRRFAGRKRSFGSKGYQYNIPKLPPLLKGVKMIDGRTKEQAMAAGTTLGSS